MTEDHECVRRRYDQHAEEYHRLRNNPSVMWFNTYVDNPSVLSVLSEIGVAKKDVLDVGCGSGIFSAQVKELGANVVGSDISEKFIEIARREHPNIEFFVCDASKMGFPDSSFDVVVSTLMAHYFEDLTNLFKEVNRVLLPNGDYVFSMTHPSTAFWYNSWGRLVKGETTVPLDPYFVKNKKHTWSLSNENGNKVFSDMPFYRHNIEDVSVALDASGFNIKCFKEPRPIPAGKEVNPTLYEVFTKFPVYLTVHAKKR